MTPRLSSHRSPARRAADIASDIEGMPSPAAVVVEPSYVRVGDGYAATFAVVGYPAEVGPAWLDPLLSYPGRVDVTVHIDPVPAAVAAPMLKRQRARLESTRRLDADAGRVGDPLVEAAADDAANLAARVARGAAKLFRTGIYVTVHARTLDELGQVAAGVRSAAASVLLDLQPATFRHQHGWTTTLPLGVDRLGMRRVLDTDALAAAFPFASADLPAPAPGQLPTGGPVLYGVNTTSSGVLLWDRWAADNHNSVVLARSGAGKSYFVKLDVLRNLYQGVQVAVIDPEDEYTPLAEHVGGTVIQLGHPGVRVNPLDLPAGDTRPDVLTRRGLFLHTAIAVMLGAPPAPEQRAALDRAITATYRTAGITPDPGTWTRPAPLLRDLAAHLAKDSDPASRQLAARLHPWTTGSFAGLFDGPTTVGAGSTRSVGSHLTVWSLRHLPDELRPIGTLLALDAIWRDTDAPAPRSGSAPAATSAPSAVTVSAGRRRLVVVDEAWLLMRDGEGARFLSKMAKAARKRATGLTVVTQDAADVLGSDLGMAVVSNAATQILMRQAPQAIDAVTTAFGLTTGEAHLLLHAPRGEALLIAGTARIPFRVVGSPTEDQVARTGITAHQDDA
jgi:type IV secretory pathway VirB4 component